MRIVAGTAKGRRLTSPGEGTRPTSDRAREGVFNTLAATMRLDGARVLDLFAGTGALGLEALSRGADVAVLVDSSRVAVEVAKANADAVGLPGARVVRSAVSRFLSAGNEEDGYDLVFLDPPYAMDTVRVLGSVIAVAHNGWLASDAVVVVERSVRDGNPLAAIGNLVTPTGERRYGETLFCYGRAR